MFLPSGQQNLFEHDQLMIRADGQPPPLSTAYANWSPVSHRKAMKPAGITGQISEPNPKPVHFNRPSPTSSPVLTRKTRTGGEPIRGQVVRPLFQDYPGIQNQQKISGKFQSPYESSTNFHHITSRKNEELHLQKKEENKKGEPFEHNTPIQLTGESGQFANNKPITPMPRSLKGQSFTKTAMVENLTESVREYSSFVTVVKAGLEAPIETRVQQALAQTSTKGPQSPTPWRKAKTPGDASAKSDVETAGTQPSWRKQEQLKNFSDESVTSVSNSDMISTKPQTVVPQQKQSQTGLSQQKQSQIQTPKGAPHQDQEPVYEEAPWRSPHSKRKEYNKISSTSPPIKEVTTSASMLQKTPSIVAATSQSSSALIGESTVTTTSSASSSTPAPPIPPHQNFGTKTAQYSPNLPHKPPLPSASITVSSTSTTMATTTTVCTAESVKTEEVSKVIQVNEEAKKVEETTEKVITSTELKLSEKVFEESVSIDSESKAKEVMVKSDSKSQETGVPESQSTVLSMPTSEEVKTPEPQPTLPTEVQVTPEHLPPPTIPETNTLVGSQPLPPPPPPIFKSVDVAGSNHQPPPPPPPPKKSQPYFSQPSPASLPLRLTNPSLQNENAEPSPDFVQEPITSRIQRFEKQSSFERELKEKQIATAKPVGPWVKKTSSGPVQSDMWVDYSSQEKQWPEPPPSSYFDIETNSKMSSVAPTIGQMASDGPSDMLAMQHKQIQKLLQRPRTKSSGDFSHSYLDNEESAAANQEKMKAPIVPSKPGAPSPVKGDVKKTSDLFDPMCDPNNPRIIQFQDVSAAAFKVKSGIMNTPCTRSNMSTIVNMDVFFKKEFNQYTGSFKERGARYTLLCLSEEQKSRGVIAASAGNHALALSYHGQNLGIPVTVVMPLVAPIMKVQACRQYGANILVKGSDIGECKEIALRMAKEQNLLYINGYDHPHILAGQGTMGLEIVEQVSNIDAVVVPVGGGGLIAGIALAVKSLYPHIKVIGVEAEKCASFTAAMKAGKPVYVKAESSLADGLAVPMVGVNAFATASKLVDKIVTVREEWIAIAILRLVEMEKAVVEGAGAAALAALLAGELPELVGKRVVIPLCGGNIDTTVLGRCLERGLAADGRLVKFTVTVSDRPGGIADLTRLLANLGVSIKDMLHERAWIRSDIFSVEVKVLCETRDHEHSEELRQALLQKYKELRFGAVPE